MSGNTKHLVFSVCVAFVLCAFASVASARTIYVPDDYEKIQWAVDNASDGDMIIVRDGTYTENVDVNVDNLTLKSENGSDSTIVQASSPGDFVFEVTADRVNISGFTIKGKWEEKGVGIYIAADNCSIFNNNVSNNTCGIYLYYSSNNRITENNISNSIYGILLYSSPKNNLSNNIMENNGIFIYGGCVSDFNTHVIENNIINGKPIYYCKNKEGIKIPEDAGEVILANCSRMIVENTDVSNGSVGIELAYTTKSSISNNNVNSNKDCGIILFSSSTNKISGNNVSSNGHGIYLEGSCNDNIIINNNASNNFYSIRLSCSNNNNISSNNVSNNRYGIYLWNSFKNNINNNKVSNNYKGLNLEDSSNNTVSNNDISSNNISIYLFDSPNNDIIKNNISNNNFGIYLSLRSSNNTIYLNDFSNNTKNVYYAYYSTNIWNSTSPFTYIYDGNPYTNYMGNYWDDYTGSDADGDGIGDTPYIIDSDKDNYPLIEQFERYFVPTPAKIFDTGRPENPYPSISGEFVGTIKTNKKIIATKLYTYACEGTGGHTEHALICNSTWCAEAKWDGYKGDWMNISFNKTVILMPHETYNITIVTGSYPQIHHTHSLKTENGWINCTEFTDANGNKYENWIPAIKLWS